MVVTPYEMQRQAGWPVTPLASLEYHKEGVLREGRISAASLAEALASSALTVRARDGAHAARPLQQQLLVFLDILVLLLGTLFP